MMAHSPYKANNEHFHSDSSGRGPVLLIVINSYIRRVIGIDGQDNIYVANIRNK